jgi:hypothetical protein
MGGSGSAGAAPWHREAEGAPGASEAPRVAGAAQASAAPSSRGGVGCSEQPRPSPRARGPAAAALHLNAQLLLQFPRQGRLGDLSGVNL